MLSKRICQAVSDREYRLHRSTQIFRDNNNDVGKADGLLRMVNANFETGVVVITHGEGLDVDAVKKAIADAGFSVA